MVIRHLRLESEWRYRLLEHVLGKIGRDGRRHHIICDDINHQVPVKVR